MEVHRVQLDEDAPGQRDREEPRGVGELPRGQAEAGGAANLGQRGEQQGGEAAEEDHVQAGASRRGRDGNPGIADGKEPERELRKAARQVGSPRRPRRTHQRQRDGGADAESDLRRADEEAPEECRSAQRVERDRHRPRDGAVLVFLLRAQEPADADGDAGEEALHHQVAADLVDAEPVVGPRRGDQRQHRAAHSHGEADGNPEKARRPARAARAPESKLEHHRDEQEPEELAQLPSLQRGAHRGGDGREDRDGDLPERGRLGAGAPRNDGEEQTHREAGEESFQLGQGMQERPIHQH